MTGRPILFAVTVLAFSTLAACKDTGVDARAAADVEIAGGDDQEVLYGGTLADPLQVRVTDSDGEPVSGARVAWSASGGTLSASESVSDVSGIAQVTWAMATPSNQVPIGKMQATATVQGLAPAIFTGWSRRGVELKSVSFSPGQVNVASGPATVTFTVHATTDLGEVTAGTFRFGPGEGAGIQNTRVFLVSGTAQDGTWQGTAQIPQGATAGAWTPMVTLQTPLQQVTWSHAPSYTNGLQNVLTVTQ